MCAAGLLRFLDDAHRAAEQRSEAHAAIERSVRDLRQTVENLKSQLREETDKRRALDGLLADAVSRETRHERDKVQLRESLESLQARATKLHAEKHQEQERQRQQRERQDQQQRVAVEDAVRRAVVERERQLNTVAIDLEARFKRLYQRTELTALDTKMLFDELKRFEILPDCVRILVKPSLMTTTMAANNNNNDDDDHNTDANAHNNKTINPMTNNCDNVHSAVRRLPLRSPEVGIGRVVDSHDVVQRYVDSCVSRDAHVKEREREHRRRHRHMALAEPTSSGISGGSVEEGALSLDPAHWREVRRVMECVILILEIFLGPKAKIDVGITHRDPSARLSEKATQHGHHQHGRSTNTATTRSPMQLWAVYRFPKLDQSHTLELSLQALIKNTNRASYANGGNDGGNRVGLPGVGGGGQSKRNEPHWVYACFWVEE